ncbi:MAG: pitrilysin family protein [Ornithinimicrobium sp.]
MSVAARPAVTPAQPWSFPAPQIDHLSNGLQVVRVEVPGQHVLSVRLGIPVALSAEPRHLQGVATLMARGLDEGTERHTSQQFAELIERHGIALGAGVGERGVVVEMEVLPHHFAASLDIMAQCLTEATYPDLEVARLKRARLSDIEHEYADAGARASLEFARTYFEAQDRAARPVAGARDTVAAVTAEDIRAYHRRVMDPRGATLVVAGDSSGLDQPLLRLLERALKHWTAPGAPGCEVDDSRGDSIGVRHDQAARVVLVDRPGSAQSHVLLGRPGPDRRTEHGWGAYQVLAFLLGGSPSARIDAVLREERGYTYGMRAQFRPRRNTGVCSVSGAVRADATAPALSALRQVLALRGSDLTQREVRHGADFVAKTAPGRYSTADTIASEVVRLALDDLDVGFVTQTLDTARSLTRDQAGAAWDEVADGPGWSTIVVADAASHLEPLSELGLGEITVVAANDAP